jgi:hypothetical protein
MAMAMALTSDTRVIRFTAASWGGFPVRRPRITRSAVLGLPRYRRSVHDRALAPDEIAD